MDDESTFLRNFSSLQERFRETYLGKMARFLQVGKFLLWLTSGSYLRRLFFDLGPLNFLRFLKARHTYLRVIASAPGLNQSTRLADFEVHMLLNHARIFEGAWALYAFIRLSENNVPAVVHDDGSLRPRDKALLKKLIPSVKIWDRRDADEICIRKLNHFGFKKLIDLRKSLIFGLKLVDPIILSEKRLIIILDSDVLFFNKPDFLLNALEKGQPTYSVDSEDTDLICERRMKELIGRPAVYRCNAGLLSVDRTLIQLERYEKYLHEPEFWNEDRSANYYAEQTLWAMELTRLGAVALPSSYAISPLDPADCHSGHFHHQTSCGHALLYTKGLPTLCRTFWPKEFA